MTITYYHGAPGSYKTSSMVRDWLLPEIKKYNDLLKPRKFGLSDRIKNYLGVKLKPLPEPRKVISNVRGIKDFPFLQICNNSDIIPAVFLAEPGTLFLIDEIGQVSDNHDLKKDSFTSTLFSDENGKLENINTFKALLDKHRHFNFDIVVTAPTIKRVPDIIRAVSEYGYKHKNLSTLGLKGFYLQGQHIGEDTGGAESHFTKKVIKFMRKKVFTLYSSTVTGKFHESPIKDAALYKHPAVLTLVVFIAFAVYYFMQTPSISKPVIPGVSDKVNNSPIMAGETPKPVNPISTDVNSLKPLQKPLDPNLILIENTDDKVMLRGYYVTKNEAYAVVGTCNKSRMFSVKPSQISQRGVYIETSDSLLFVPLAVNNCVIKDDTVKDDFKDRVMEQTADNIKID